MAWGRSSISKPPPPPKSALRQLLPLIILFVFLAGFTFVGYHLYLTFQQISKNTSEKMQSKNVVFSKDGLKVGVKQKSNENYVDTTQSFFVKAWNLSTFPAYKSRLWNKPQEGNAEARRPYSRTASGAH